MKPNISICIPTFNRKDYLKQALDSIFAQTYKDFEVVVVDDGSTDGTEEMIKNSAYSVRYYWQENRGEAVSRNRLIKLAQCQFITFLDSDDLLMPDAVERMAKAIAEKGEDVVVYGPYYRIDHNGNITGRCKRKLYSGYVTKYLFGDIFIHSCGSMFPRKALEEIGGFDETLRFSGDYDLWLRLSLKYPFIGLPQPTFKRRRHQSNLSATSSQSQIIQSNVLERFYYEKGGDAVIPKRIAIKRLSKVEYRVGRNFLAEKNTDNAIDYFRKSFRRYPNIKSALYLGKTALARFFTG
jgi:glycosyltransferase involved in cell wall biosynthesis